MQQVWEPNYQISPTTMFLEHLQSQVYFRCCSKQAVFEEDNSAVCGEAKLIFVLLLRKCFLIYFAPCIIIIVIIKNPLSFIYFNNNNILITPSSVSWLNYYLVRSWALLLSSTLVVHDMHD